MKRILLSVAGLLLVGVGIAENVLLGTITDLRWTSVDASRNVAYFETVVPEPPDPPGDPVAGLIGHWKMNDNAENTVVEDSSGYAMNGAAYEATALLARPGKRGGALFFNGVSQAEPPVNLGDTYYATDELSISVWAFVDASTLYGYANIFGKWDDNTCGYTLSIYYDRTLAFYGIGEYQTWWDRTFSTGTVIDGWNHIVVAYSYGAVQFYINNTDAGTGYTDYPINPYLSGVNTYIGGVQAFAGSGWWYPYGGLLDDVRLYNRAITVEDVGVLWNNGFGTETR